MNIEDIEFAAEIVYAICREHPEICPHSYEWKWIKVKENETREVHYKCRLCGHEYVKIEKS